MAEVLSPEARSRAHFIAGDPVRGLAAVGVIALHCASTSLVLTGNLDLVREPYDAWGRAVGGLLSAGGAAAFLFFALSGFLLSRPYLRAFVHGQPYPRPLRYVRHRVMRIAPAYWVVLTIVLLLPTAPHISGVDVLLAYALSLDWSSSSIAGLLGQAWTLNAEIRFYLLLPLAALALVLVGRWAGPRLGPSGRAALVAAIAVATAVLTLLTTDGASPYFAGGLSALFAFMPGVALAAVEQLPLRRLLMYRLAPTLAWLTALTGAVLWMAQVPNPMGGGAIGNFLWQDLLMLLIMGGLLVHQWAGRVPSRALANPVTNWLGTRSYGLYLVHLPVLWVLGAELTVDDRYKLTFLVLLVVVSAISAVLAELLHRLVELPAMRRRDVAPRDWLRPLPRRAPAPPVPTLPAGAQPLTVPAEPTVAHSAEISHQ